MSNEIIVKREDIVVVPKSGVELVRDFYAKKFNIKPESIVLDVGGDDWRDRRRDAMRAGEIPNEAGPDLYKDVDSFASGQDFDLCSTQINLPAAVAARIQKYQQQIQTADLADHGLETEPHITVKYGIHHDDPESIRQIIEGAGPFRIRLGKLSVFEGTHDGDVLKVEVESPELRLLNKKIGTGVDVTDTHPEYNPHVTIAYLKPGKAEQYVAGSNDLAGVEFKADTVQFCGQDGKQTAIKL